MSTRHKSTPIFPRIYLSIMMSFVVAASSDAVERDTAFHSLDALLSTKINTAT